MSSNGIKVTVEDPKCVQANVFVQSGIFQEFVFKEESVPKEENFLNEHRKRKLLEGSRGMLPGKFFGL